MQGEHNRVMLKAERDLIYEDTNTESFETRPDGSPRFLPDKTSSDASEFTFGDDELQELRDDPSCRVQRFRYFQSDRNFARVYLDPDLQSAILSETDWVPYPDLLHLTKVEAEEVGMGRMECPLCKCKGGTFAQPVRGADTCIKTNMGYQCFCNNYRKFFPKWNAMVPLAYRDFRMAKLVPYAKSPVPVPIQRGLITRLKANSGKSHLIIGPPATSKTVYSTCLFGLALEEWVDASRHNCGPLACWYVSAFDLLKQHHIYATKEDAPEPLVTVEKIRRAVAAGQRPRLFLEELDKVSTVSEFKASVIFELVKEIDAQKGQIVVTANSTFKELEKMYAIRDGEALMRRFTERNSTGDGITLDLFPLVN